jgi:hypothetical protein
MAKAAQKIEASADEAVSDQPVHDTTLQTTDIHQDAKTEAEKVLDEIQQAANQATESLAKDASLNGTAPASEPAEVASATDGEGNVKSEQEIDREKQAAHEARVAYLVKRAKTQKERGRAQLERVVVGAMAIRKDVEFFDVSIASSAERFLGLIDLSIYTINRRGEYILGETDAEKVMERFASLVSAYRDGAISERDQADILLKNEQDLVFDEDWIVPEYRQTAFKMSVYIKHPASLKVLEGLFAFDNLVKNLTVLQWNGKVDQVRIDQARHHERQALSKIHQFAASSLIGLNRRARPAARSSRPPRAETPATTVQNEEAAVAA